MRSWFCALSFFSFCCFASGQTFSDSHGAKHDPFQTRAQVNAFVFVRTDCPISNRYAPELSRIANEFSNRGVAFWLVYSDHDEKPAAINQQIADYHLPGTALLDPDQQLARRAEASVAPQAAVFKNAQLLYSGRIDDRFVDFGKTRAAATTHDLEDALTAILEGKPPRHPRTRATGCFLADVK